MRRSAASINSVFLVFFALRIIFNCRPNLIQPSIALEPRHFGPAYHFQLENFQAGLVGKVRSADSTQIGYVVSAFVLPFSLDSELDRFGRSTFISGDSAESKPGVVSHGFS